MRVFKGMAHFVLALSIVAACGGNKGGEEANPNPKSPEEAVKGLPESYQASFSSWKKKLVKNCNASALFAQEEESATSEKGIDFNVLLDSNENSLIYKGVKGELVYLHSPKSFAGVSQSKFEKTETVNSKGYQVTAETKREGSVCTVSIYGQKVFEFPYVAKIAVSGFVSSEGVKTQKAISIPLKQYAAKGLSSLDAMPFMNLVHSLYSAKPEALKFLANRLSLTNEEANAVLESSQQVRFPVMRLAGETFWFDGNNTMLVAKAEQMGEVIAQTEKKVSMEWRLSFPQVGVGSRMNTADAGVVLRTQGEIISTPDAADPKLHQLILSTVSPTETIQPNEADATACIGTRVAFLKAVSTLNALQVQPSVNDVSLSCASLVGNSAQVFYTNGSLKRAAVEVLRDYESQDRLLYSGWDQVLTNYVLEAFSKSEDIVVSVDPERKLKLVKTMSDYLQGIKPELASTAQLKAQSNAVNKMALKWAYTGKIVQSSRILRILRATDISVTPFTESTLKLLSSLEGFPDGLDAELSFAENLTEEYKSEALKARALAQSLSYTYWEREFFDSVLQRKPQLSELKAAAVSLQSIKTELNTYPQLGVFSAKLTKAAMGWLSTGQVQATGLNGVFSALNNVASSFTNSTELLIQDLDKSFEAHKAELEFARSLNEGFKSDALKVQALASQLGLKDFGENFIQNILQKRPTGQRVLEYKTTLEAAVPFSAREAVQAKLESFYHDSNRIELIKRGLEEVWTVNEFNAVEAISLLALQKSSCDRYHASSSLANCAGMSLFSKKEKMFFHVGYQGRYAGAASDFSGYFAQLKPDSNYYSLRSDLIRAYFGPFDVLWNTCSNDAFATKRTDLNRLIPALISTTETMKKWDLEREISKTLKNCE